MQKQLGVDQPDYGSLFDDMQIANNGKLSFARLMQPKAEAEMAFILATDLDQETIDEKSMADAIEFALPSIEIVGSRVENWDIKITDTIADNASASHFVLGDNRKTLKEIDLINCRMKMYKNGELVSEGTGEACLGSPLKAATWLAQTMKKLGQPLRKGDIILSGALGPMTNLEQGDNIRAEIDGLGTVELTIVE